MLKPGKEIVEPTSGNTGIALAFVAAARGYPITLTMPETMSIERRKVLKIFGANLVLTEGSKGMGGAIAKAKELVHSDPDRYVLLQQFENPANPEIHFKTTGPEIWEDTEGEIDVFVVGRGHRRHHYRRVPLHQASKRKENSVGCSGTRGQPRDHADAQPRTAETGPHKIQGIGAGFIPGISI